MPDLCLPVANGTWNALYIEMKKSKGKADAHQLDMHIKLRLSGNKVEVCDSMEGARAVLLEFLSDER